MPDPGDMVVIAATLIVIGVVLASLGRRRGRGEASTVGHHDPAAIGQYTLDPATLAYRYDLPTLPPSGEALPPGSGPPATPRRRRRRR